jgi:hypothetical protein
MPTSPSRAGVVNNSSQGDTGEVRKSLGLNKSGDTEDERSVREESKRELYSVVPDNAEAIACAAASSSADM